MLEGGSVRSIERLTGTHRDTILRLLVQVGADCEKFLQMKIHAVPVDEVQCDEIWGFCYAKQKNVPVDKQGQFGFGDVWTWTAIDPDSKLVLSWLVGLRNAKWANAFMKDVAKRLTNRVQLTTDGHKA